MSKTYEFFLKSKVFFVATLGDNAPAARPFGAVMEYDGALYISTANTKAVYAQLTANPAVQMVAMNPGTRDWIRVSGKAVETFDLAAKQAMLDTWPILRSRFETKESEHFALFRITEMESLLHTGDEVIRLD